MKLLLFITLLIALPALAVETDFSGNIEGQLRHVKNNDQAKEELLQNWDNENFYLVYGNLNGKVEMKESRVEGNLFMRYSHSDLYDSNGTPYFATQIYTFPNKLVARDLFKLQHLDQNDQERIELLLNKLYYERELGNNRIMLGRLYVNYGLGEIFNPINPFNQPTSLTSISQVAQGNDGLSFTYFKSDTHSIQFLLLGDKSFKNYDGSIEETLWINGEYQFNEKLQFIYVLGQDQNRYKLGGQTSYQFTDSLVFTQLLFQSEWLDNEDSNNLWDFLIGYDEQLTSKWHIRFEGGYQKANRFTTPAAFERFLPTEYFVSISNVYELHPLVKVSGSLIEDLKSGFLYAIGKSTFDLGHDLETELFIFSPVAKGDDTDNPAQKLVTTDVGVSLRAFF